MYRLRRLTISFVCFAVSVCALPAAGQLSSPVPQPPPGAPLAQPQPSAAAQLALPMIEPAARSLRTWAEATQLMEAHQPALQQQRAAVARARASVEQALSRLLPRLDVGAGVEFTPAFPSNVSRSGSEIEISHKLFETRSVTPDVNAALSVTFSLADLARRDGAQAGVEAEVYGLAAERNALMGTLAGAVLGALAAERVASRNEAGLAAAQERMRLTQRLVALGRATTLDALRFSQDLGEAQQTLVSARETLSEVREDLGSALGLAEPVAVLPEFDGDSQVPGCRPLARIEERSDRLAAIKRAEQAADSSRAAGLAYLPELQIGTQYQGAYGALRLVLPFDGPREFTHNWTASVNVVWTLYDGGLRSSASTQAEAARIEAQAAEDALNIATRTEYRRAVRLVSVTRASLEIAQHTTEAARQADSLSRRALELGDASALEVVDTARRLRALESTLATREVEWLAARVRAQLAIADCR